MSDDLEPTYLGDLFGRPLAVVDEPASPQVNVVPGEGNSPSPGDNEDADARRFAVSLFTERDV